MFTLFFLIASVSSKALLRELLQNSSYNPVDSPFDIDGEQLVVSLEITYGVLAYVEENRQIVSYILNIDYVWLDSRLQFNSSETGISYAILPANLVWIPTVDCYNCVEVQKMDMETQFNEVRVNPNGTVRIISRARFDTLCRTEIAAFPFDVQYCGIYFDAGLAELDRVRFVPLDVVYNSMIGTPEWNIAFDKSYVNDSLGYTLALISFKLTRNSEFYVIFLILPTMVVSSVSLAAILLPLEMSKGEKVNMGVTGMLGLTFLLSIIVQEVPRSERLPVLGQWVIVEMFICIFTLIVDEPIRAIQRRLRKKVARTPHWLLVVDYVAFAVIFLGNILFTILIFTILPHNKHVVVF